MEAEGSVARILIADDHDLMREGLRAMVSGEPDLEVVGEARDGREAVEMCRELRPDLVLMDVRMPRMDGLEATRAIKGWDPKVGVLMVTTYEDPSYLLEAVKAGAAGYVIKDATRQELVDAIRRALEGEHPLDQDLAMQLLKRLATEQKPETKPPPEPLAEPLTDRELEVLRRLARGRTNPQISSDLYVSEGTVKAHVRRIIQKLDVSDRTQAAVKAIDLGLIER
ncbi:MAG: response regulator transcription factor [Rubrobacteraceae bacterium]